MTVEMTETSTDQGTRVSFLWLEITGKCQLACEHCYADSGPTGSHGNTTGADWMRVIDEASELGVEMVQFIGGEPPLHPAVRRDIALRVGLVDLSDEQRVSQATEQLSRVGVEEIGIDRLRGVGRGAQRGEPDVAELCGSCGQGVMTIAPDGSVWPCVFSRWMDVGNVQVASFASILNGARAQSARRELAASFGQRRQAQDHAQCNPNCLPQTCQPQCGPNRTSRVVGEHEKNWTGRR